MEKQRKKAGGGDVSSLAQFFFWLMCKSIFPGVNFVWYPCMLVLINVFSFSPSLPASLSVCNPTVHILHFHKRLLWLFPSLKWVPLLFRHPQQTLLWLGRLVPLSASNSSLGLAMVGEATVGGPSFVLRRSVWFKSGSSQDWLFYRFKIS